MGALAELRRAVEGPAPAGRGHLAGALRRIADEAVAVEPRLLEGPPVDILVAESASADLLVVGSHRHRHLDEVLPARLSGSVSGGCARRATCPTVVVPATVPAAPDADATAAGPPEIAVG